MAAFCAQAAPYAVVPSADTASQELVFDNQRVSAISVEVGARGVQGVVLTVDRFAKRAMQVQCIGDGDGLPPDLTVSLEGRVSTLKTRSPDLSDGAPAVWISSAQSGRAQLERLIRSERPTARLVHRSIKNAPEHFAGLRFSRLVLISHEDLVRLNEAQRAALFACQL